jgi:hypothetical protein
MGGTLQSGRWHPRVAAASRECGFANRTSVKVGRGSRRSDRAHVPALVPGQTNGPVPFSPPVPRSHTAPRKEEIPTLRMETGTLARYKHFSLR